MSLIGAMSRLVAIRRWCNLWGECRQTTTQGGGQIKTMVGMCTLIKATLWGSVAAVHEDGGTLVLPSLACLVHS